VAQQVSVSHTDDLDGSKAAETVSFSLDGGRYEIDLSARNARALRKALAEFVAAARPLKSGSTAKRRQPRTRARREVAAPNSAAIRAWAADNGVAVSPRGRISQSVVEQYRAAHTG
jgi:hypothetical protein